MDLHQKVVNQIMAKRGEKGLTGEELKAIEVEVAFHMAGMALMQCLHEDQIEAIDVHEGEILWQKCEPKIIDTDRKPLMKKKVSLN